MERAFRQFEINVPPPQPVPWKDGFVFRHTEKTIHQALVQKLTRILSGLYAADLLVENGFTQEQGVLQRTLDELNDDTMFLALACTTGVLTELHQQYLAAFYEEEFDDPNDVVNSTQKRNTVPRRKIQAYLSRQPGNGSNPSRQLDVVETVHKAYSGFVHAASPQIMESCGGTPPRFLVRGMLGTSRVGEYQQDLLNYVYRSFISVVAVGKAFGNGPLVEQLIAELGRFEQSCGVELIKTDEAKKR